MIDREMLDSSRQLELRSWYDFNVVREGSTFHMLRSNVRPLLTKWVDVWKTDTYGSRKMKSRLSIMGNLEDAHKLRTYSPTMSKEMMLLTIHVIACNRRKVRTLDVKQAFLQSDEIDREVYVLPPPEAALGEEVVWKLTAAVYGSADASREWYRTTKRMLKECGLHEVKNEPSLFYSLDRQGKLDGILAAHVDDFLYGAEVSFLNKIEVIKAKVKVGTSQSGDVTFCGLQIQTAEEDIKVRALEVMDIEKAEVKGISNESDLTQEEETWARSIIAKLQWSAHSHRPDLCSLLGQSVSNLTKERKKRTLREINAIIDRYKEHEDMQSTFKPLRGNLELEVYGDGAFKEYNHQGLVVVIRPDSAEDINIIGSQSRKAERRAWSTLAAETHVLQHAMDKAIHMHGVLKQLNQQIVKATVVADNLSLRRCLYSGPSTKEERLRKKFAVIKEIMLTESKNVGFVPGDLMLADCLTKAKVKENSRVKAIRTNHYPTLLLADDHMVTEDQMNEACDTIEMLSLMDQRNQMMR